MFWGILKIIKLILLLTPTQLVPLDEAAYFFGVCLLGAFFGKFYLGRAIARLGRPSLIVLALAAVIAGSIAAVVGANASGARGFGTRFF